MKNRQFIILLGVILVISFFFYKKIDKIDQYEDIIINNIATLDRHLQRQEENLRSKLESIEYHVWIVETNVLAIDDWLYEVEKRLGIQ